jgi:hypothetical protein
MFQTNSENSASFPEAKVLKDLSGDIFDDSSEEKNTEEKNHNGKDINQYAPYPSGEVSPKKANQIINKILVENDFNVITNSDRHKIEWVSDQGYAAEITRKLPKNIDFKNLSDEAFTFLSFLANNSASLNLILERLKRNGRIQLEETMSVHFGLLLSKLVDKGYSTEVLNILPKQIDIGLLHSGINRTLISLLNKSQETFVDKSGEGFFSKKYQKLNPRYLISLIRSKRNRKAVL